MKSLLNLALLLGLALATDSQASEPRQKDGASPDAGPALKVLFLGDQGHHRPADRAAQITPVLAGRGIDVTYTEKLGDLNPQNLARYDALLIYANITEISPDQEKALLDYVRSGGGFVPVHCASYCFLNSPAVHRARRCPISAARHGRVRHQDRRPVASDHERLCTVSHLG